ncbi:GTPase [Corynebacterium sp. ES2775-CONJ]|uniref:GTPase n=1 Tax=Corynebacterium sp. ES2775-CONJ TaxID=2974029 RepID=UPI00216A8485|nr:GTPase [Corynebacterium sp. ES2775-CONJ]MCS4490539.1 50S ribosome-binding GTPase [Corynebacterium sp. ES2775-CONJ]
MSKLQHRLHALEAALTSQYLSPEDRDAMNKVLVHAAARRKLSSEHTVVGFFGATGSGKTSLFNAIVGEDLGASSPRRPTTSAPLAAIWQPEGASELLDWLGIEDRRTRTGSFTAKSGPLILLDLPDFDSVDQSNREIASRLAAQVDVLVWVTDPEKYADRIIHQDFIRPHASHSAVTLAVLNKADRLAPADIPEVTASLTGLLNDDGLDNVSVLATSTLTGSGITELREAIATIAASKNAQSARIVADIHALSNRLVPARHGQVGAHAKKELDRSLAQAAGVDRLAEITAAAYRRRLGLRTGSPLLTWVLKLRPDPLRRLGLREEQDHSDVHRSSLPALDAASKAISNKAVRTYTHAVADQLPHPWDLAVIEQGNDSAHALPEELDRAAARTKLPAQPSAAWGLSTFIQWIALFMALMGVLWYLAVAFIPGVLTPLLGDSLIPAIEGWPYPTLLILGGILIGILLSLMGAAFGGVIGAVVKARTRRALKKEIAQISTATVVRPVAVIRQDYEDLARALRSLA